MAPIADYHIVYAKTDPDKGTKGISAFIVSKDLPGVSVGKHEEKMGQHGVPVSDLILEDVRVPADCLLGKENMGFINAMKTLNVGRVGVASMALGIAQEALDLAVEHTKNRIQFGKPLCKNQALAFMMADMETKLNAARNLVYNAAWLMDNKEDATKAASMAKYFTTEAAIEIVNKSLQLHGGYVCTAMSASLPSTKEAPRFSRWSSPARFFADRRSLNLKNIAAYGLGKAVSSGRYAKST